MAPDDDFYDLSGPAIQQGDIFPGLPLFFPPESKELVIIRSPGSRSYIDTLSPGTAELVREQALSAFDERPEFVAICAARGLAVVITQTCDLEDREFWLITPALRVEGSGLDRGNLVAKKFSSLFYLPSHPKGHFEECYLDLTDLRQVHKCSVVLSDRVASLSIKSQSELSESLGRTLGRRWGYAAGERVPKDGQYKCNSCNHYYGIKNEEHSFKEGEIFPDCEDCRSIRKTAAWYWLRRHKK